MGRWDDAGKVLSLDEALTAIARRSFYEDAIVVPVVRVDQMPTGSDYMGGAVIGYLVEDDAGAGAADDDWQWSYDEGVHDADSVSEVSRLHGPAEFYDHAEHIRYNMRHSVEALQEGRSVSFGYTVARDADVEYDDDGNPMLDGEPIDDDVAGWILTATIWDE